MLKKQISRIAEFVRYTFVGGIAFIVDTTVLLLFKEIFLMNNPFSLYLATALGFFAGTAVNYSMCHYFVFQSVRNSGIGKTTKDIIIFILIGVIGLAINELGMLIGTELLSFNYLYVKVGIAAVVLIWNYLARKILIFNSNQIVNSVKLCEKELVQ